MRGIINDRHENIFDEYFTVIGSSELDRPTTTASYNILLVLLVSLREIELNWFHSILLAKPTEQRL